MRWSHLYLPHLRARCVVAVCLWAGWAVIALGQGGQFVRKPATLVENVDYYHEVISRRVIGAVTGFDEFFADDRFLEETNETQIRLSSAVRYEDGKSLTLRLSLKGRIVLPHLEERFLVFVDTDGRERDIKDQLNQVDQVTEDDKSIFTGVRYRARETRRSRVSLDGGLRWRSGPVPFARVRGRRSFTYEDWDIRLTQLVFWFSDRGFGETTTLDFDYKLDPAHYFRASPSATWSEISRGMDLRQIFSFFHIMNEDTMIAFDLDLQESTHPTFRLDRIQTMMRWRQRSYRDWMFFEVSPGLAFPREADFELTPIIAFKVEVLFGDPQLRQTLPLRRGD